MTMQIQGAPIALTVRSQATGVPTADGDGIAMSQFQRATNNPNRPKRFLVQVDITNVGTSCKLTLWLRSKLAGAWGVPVDPSGNFGVLGNNTALPAGKTYFFIFEDISGCSEVVIVQSANAGGTPVVTATISAITEGGR